MILAYRRPKQLAKLIETLKKIKPKNLYISVDGPKKSNPIDKELVKQTKEVIERNINWDCTIKKKYNVKNLGCKMGVSSAISWFFDHINEGIILEEDCLLHEDFYKFAEQLLEFYRDNKQIWTITSNNLQKNQWRGDGSYYYSRIPHCWGWATWKDRWINYHQDLTHWELLKSTNMIKNIFTKKGEREYWIKIFDNLKYNDMPDSWAYRWFFVSLINSGLTVAPNINMATNIGFDNDASNTKSGSSPIMCDFSRPTNIFPIKHPTFFLRSIEADDFTFNNFYRKSLILRIKNKLQKILNFKNN